MTSASDRIRVGVVGAGWIGQHGHIEGFQANPGCEVAAVCCRTGSRAAEVARRYGIPRAETDYRRLLEATDIDLVSFAVPDHLHYPMVLEALAAGKHVLCEKPLARSYDEARTMERRADAAGVRHMTCFTWRFTPLAVRMAELVREGYLGRIFHVTAATLIGPTGFPAGSPPVVLAQPPGGILSAAGSHLLDLVMSLVGAVESVAASCVRHVDEPALFVRRGRRTSRVRPDDSTVLLARIAGGVQAAVHLSAVAVGRPAAGFMRIEIHGERGALLHELCIGPGPSRVLACPLGGTRFEPVDIPSGMQTGLELDNLSMDRIVPYCFRGMAAELLAAIREGRRAEPGFREGARSQAVIDAAVESSLRGRWVRVPGR